MKQLLSLLLCFCLIVSGCAAANNDDSQSYEEGQLEEATIRDDLPRPSFLMHRVWGSAIEVDLENIDTVPIDLVICSKGDNPFTADHIKNLAALISQAGLPELRITHVSGYEVINEALLNAISQDLGKNWDLLYFEESALGNAKMEELFLALNDDLATGGRLEEAFKLLPQEAWEASQFGGYNYSVAQIPPVVSIGIQLTPFYLNKVQMSAEDFYRQDPWNMDEIFATLYERNGNHMFLDVEQTTIKSPNYEQDLIAAGVDISPRFTMLYPYVGIETGEGGAAVNILDSAEQTKAAESMQRYVDSGYAADYNVLIEDISGKTMSDYYSEPDYERCYEQYFNLTTIYGSRVSQLVPSWTDGEGYYQVPLGESSYIMEKGARPMLVVSKYSQRENETLRMLNFLLTNHEAQKQLVFQSEYAPDEDGIVRIGWEWRGLATTPVLLPTEKTNQRYPQLEDTSIYESMQIMYSEAEMAAGTGFMFDPEPVLEQIDAVEKVLNAGFETMEMDQTASSRHLFMWEGRRLSLLEDMQEAGIEDIVDEINRQMSGE